MARKLGRPVKWTESRSESYQATIHGRDQIQDIEIAADPRRQDPRADGRPARRHGRLPAAGHAGHPGARRVHVQRASTSWTPTGSTAPGVFTTKTPTDAYRGAGRPEATFAIERIMDELAAELGIDPMELRRRNWIKHEEFPYTTIAGLTYDSGNYEAATDKAHGAVRLRRAARASRPSAGTRNDPVQLGIGISTYTEMCGLAPSRVLGALSLRRGRLGVGRRSGCCRPARSRSSPAPPRTARAT